MLSAKAWLKAATDAFSRVRRSEEETSPAAAASVPSKPASLSPKSPSSASPPLKMILDGGEVIDVVTLAKVLRDPRNTRFRISYHHRVTVKYVDGEVRSEATFTFDRAQLEAFLVGTLLVPEAVRGLVARVFHDPRVAARHVRQSALMLRLLGDRAQKLTNLSPLVKELRAESALATQHAVLLARTDGSLLDLLRQTGRLTATQVAGLLRSVVGLLAVLHERGYVHGAVAIHNVLYASGGYGGVRFVLANYDRVARATAAAPGSRPQAPPETARLDSADLRDLARLRPEGRAASGRAHAVSSIDHPAQQDLVPLAILLHRLASAVADSGVEALLHDLARACAHPDAGFETLRASVMPKIEAWRATLGIPASSAAADNLDGPRRQDADDAVVRSARRASASSLSTHKRRSRSSPITPGGQPTAPTPVRPSPPPGSP